MAFLPDLVDLAGPDADQHGKDGVSVGVGGGGVPGGSVLSGNVAGRGRGGSERRPSPSGKLHRDGITFIYNFEK